MTDRLICCRYIPDNWVSEQIDYCHKKSLQHHNRHDRYRFTGNILFMSAIISALILFALAFLENKQSVPAEHSYDLLHSILVVCTHSFLVLSGDVFGYNEKRIFSEQSKTFQKMYQLFSHAHEKLEKNISRGNITESEEIIRELALESLMENSDWLLLHRSRPMEIPRG